MQSQLGRPLIRRIVLLGVALLVATTAVILIGRVPLGNQYAIIQNLSTMDQSTALIELALVNQETGQRGYDLTGMTSFLGPFREGTVQFHKTSRNLEFWPSVIPAFGGRSRTQ